MNNIAKYKEPVVLMHGAKHVNWRVAKEAGCAGEVQQAIQELGIQLNQTPKELLALADANDDQV